ncbi:MAG: toll/interleukin-1 receptor domain-containing protein [Candidatus Omnitrophota bacterium]
MKSETEVRDVFLCHASVDKKEYVKPLLDQLSLTGITYWYDEAEIRWGDSLVGKINEGLRRSRFVLIFLSKNFVERNWPEKELNAAIGLGINSGTTIALPLLIGNDNDIEAILGKYPLLRDKKYERWDKGVDSLIISLKARLQEGASQSDPDKNVYIYEQKDNKKYQKFNGGKMTQFIIYLILFFISSAGVWFFGSKAWETGTNLWWKKPETQQMQPHQSASGNNSVQLMSTGNNSPVTYIDKQVVNPSPKNEVVNNIVNIPNALGNESQGSGRIMEGKRSNILEQGCIEKIVEKNSGIAKIEVSPVAPAFKQATFHLEPKSIVNIEFEGKPILLSNYYTFSFIIFSRNQIVKSDVWLAIQGDNVEAPTNFYFEDAIPYQDIKAENIKTFRPQVSSYFPEAPHSIKGKIRITNTRDEPSDISIVLPVIEEGSFASTPIVSGATRNAVFLSYESKGNLPSDLNNGGTIGFMFSPYWDASRLTPGYNPHFLNWTDKNGTNGIKIIADSKDKGKIKVSIAVDGKTTTISSDVVPLKGEVYSVIFRFQKGSADLIVNGNNKTPGKNIAFPDVAKLDTKFFIGCNPYNENDGAFSVIKNIFAYARWLNDDEVKAIINYTLEKR